MPRTAAGFEALFTDPDLLRPAVRIEQVTEQAASEFASLAERLRARDFEPQRVAHFLNRVLFCLFAEDVGMLPPKLFQRAFEAGLQNAATFSELLAELFAAMATGGRFGFERIEHFNGGLFADGEVLPLTREEVALLHRVSTLNWSQVEPAIFGTLFERGLDPAKRSQIGAHYTDRESILRIVEPVLMAPLRRDFQTLRAKVEELLGRAVEEPDKKKAAGLRKKARQAIEAFRHDRLDAVRVLDPACGSGNFLYIALELLHDLEKEVLVLLSEVEQGQLSLDLRVGPHMVHGLEINPFAHELAQVVIWIGHFQWMLRNGFAYKKDPILKPIETIECRDAVLDLSDPAEPKPAAWPAAEVVVGNPPFLGTKRQFGELGREYTNQLRAAYEGTVPGFADLVCYWFERARQEIAAGRLSRAGLVATNSIRGGANREVLDRIQETGAIFHAWSDEPWINEGAAVRVSLIGFGPKDHGEPLTLDGQPAPRINADLTSGADLSRAKSLAENRGLGYVATVKAGPFDVPGSLAREWLLLPNPNGRPNSEVLRPWSNGQDITRRSSDTWIIDFGVDMSHEAAAQYEAPFAHVVAQVKPLRDSNNRTSYRNYWWLLAEPIPRMRRALEGLARYIATPVVGKYRLFAWVDARVLADHQLVVIARDDDAILGVLHSRVHELWSLSRGTWLGVGNDPRYTPTTTLESFPFPEGMIPTQCTPGTASDARVAPIAAAARELVRLRDAWLNPPEWVQRVPEVVPGYPHRLLPLDEKAAAQLKKRTLTNLYNERPTWLVNAHRALDEAVAAAYDWPADLSDEEIRRRLLDLNLSRAAADEE